MLQLVHAVVVTGGDVDGHQDVVEVDGDGVGNQDVVEVSGDLGDTTEGVSS